MQAFRQDFIQRPIDPATIALITVQETLLFPVPEGADLPWQYLGIIRQITMDPTVHGNQVHDRISSSIHFITLDDEFIPSLPCTSFLFSTQQL